MSNIIPLPGSGFVPPPPCRPPHPYAAFVDARQAMMRALAAWLQTNPDPASAALEMDGTLSMMDQLRQLEAAHG